MWNHHLFVAPTEAMLQKGHSSYQKYHLTKMAPNKSDTSQKLHLAIYVIGFWQYYQPPASITYPHTIRNRGVIVIPLLNRKNFFLEYHDHEPESFKNK